MKASLDALVFAKQLGFHRDASRLYFQETTKLNDYGTGYERASVTVTKGLITIRPLKEA